MERKRSDKGAFTIVELLVVILIISMIAVFVGGRVFRGLGKAKRDVARAKMAIIENALLAFYSDCERYPDQTEELDALLVAPAGLEEKWKGPYLKRSDLLDPWDNRYIYVQEGEHTPGSFDLVSLGADGEDGGEGDNEDIYND